MKTQVQSLTHRNIVLVFIAVLIGLASPAWAWWGNSYNTPSYLNGVWDTYGDCGTYWLTYGKFTSCANRNANAGFNPGFGWNGRGYIAMDWVFTGKYGMVGQRLRYRNTGGGLTGAYADVDMCAHTCSWGSLLYGETGDMSGWNGVHVDCNESWTTGCGSVCGYAPTSLREIHMWGDKWVYLNDWIVFGGYGSSSVSDTSNRSFPWAESGLYAYGAIRTDHGNVIANALFSGKVPYRVQTGDCGNAGLGNYLNFKGNAGQNSNNNCDYCSAYAFGWVYTSGGASPQWGIGSDDGVRIWQNGTLIHDNNANRGLTWDQDRIHPTGMSAGWNRVLFKVYSGVGGFSGAISFHHGGDFAQLEPSVSLQGDRYGGFSRGYEEDSWYPRIDVATFQGVSNPQPNANIYSNDTTITADGTASVTGPVPFWKVMQYQWGYNMGGVETNFSDVSSSGTSWSHTQTGVTGHRRFHFFSVSRSGRCSFQNSGSSGGWNFADGGPANYIDVYVDNVKPYNPAFNSSDGVVVSGTTQINLKWDTTGIPLDRGIGIGDGADEAADEASCSSTNYYRRGDVGVQVRRNGTAVYGWGTATSKLDMGLTPNTSYTYDIAARDNSGSSRGSWNNTTSYVSTTTKYTWAPVASEGNNIACNKSTSTWYGIGSTYTFSNPAGFGVGTHGGNAYRVSKYRYVWDKSSTYAFSGSETEWNSGTIELPPNLGDGSTYYLHLQSWNGDNIATSTTKDYGPFYYDGTPPTVTIGSPSRSATNSSTNVTYPLYFSENVSDLTTAGLTWTKTDGADGTAVVTAYTDSTFTTPTTSATRYWTVTLSNCTGNGTMKFKINAGAAVDRAGNASVESSDSATLVIDNIRPTVTSVSRLNPTAEATRLSTVHFEVVFSEYVGCMTTDEVVLNLESGKFSSASVSNISTSDGITFDITVGNIIASGGYMSISIPDSAANDPAGNGNTEWINTYDSCNGGGTGCRYLIDQGELTCVITGPPVPVQKVAGPTVTYYFSFNKATTSFTFSKIHHNQSAGINNATFSTANFARTDDTYKNYSFSVTDIVGTGSINVWLAANEFTDEFGNYNSAAGPSAFQLDQGNPSCTISRVTPTTSSTNLGTVVYRITFGLPVWGFTSSDIVLGGTAPGKSKGTFTGTNGDTIYTQEITGVTGSGTVVISVPEEVAFTDEGNGSGNTPGTALVYTIDMDLPTVTSSVRYNPSTWYTNASTVVYRVTFPESVTGVDSTDFSLTVTSGSITGASITSVSPAAAPSDGTKVYDVTVNTGSGNGDLLLQVGPNATINDLVGNSMSSSYVYAGGHTYRLDRENPAVTSVNRQDPSGQNYNGSSVVYRATFGKPVLHVDASDFALTRVSGTMTGMAITNVSAVGGTQPAEQFDITVNTGTGNGVLRLDIPIDPNNSDPITDEAANGLVAAYSTGEVYSINRDTLECVITRTQPSPNNAASVGYRIEFKGGGSTRTVTGFTVDSIHLQSTVSGATLGALSASGNAYLLNVTNLAAEASGTIYITVDAEAAQDIYGNLNTANDCGGTGDIPYVIDRQMLACTISQLSDNPTNSSNVQYQIGFNKVVSGFEFSDLDTTGTTAAGATWGALTTSDNRLFYISVSGIGGSGNVSLSVPQNAAYDVASNGNSGCGPMVYTINQVRPSCTISRVSAYRTAATSVGFTVTFGSAVTGFTTSDITLNASGFSPTPALQLTGSGANYTVTVNNIQGNGLLGISVCDQAAQDGLGNKSTAGAEVLYEIDQAAISVTVEQAASQADPTAVLPIDFEVAFSKELASGSFVAADVSFGGTGTVTEYSVTTLSAQSFRISVTAALPGTIIPTVAAGVAQDVLGNLNVASTSTDNTVTYAPGDQPQVSNWYSTREHGASGSTTTIRLSMTSAGAPKVESREGGIQKIEVFFTDDVGPKDGTLDSNEISITDGDDAPLSTERMPSLSMSDGRTLVMTFATPLVNGEYHFQVVSSKWRQVALPNFSLLSDNSTCTIIVLVGDSNQDTSNTLGDVAAIRACNRMTVDGNTALYDLNVDGQINLIDMAMARNRCGQ